MRYAYGLSAFVHSEMPKREWLFGSPRKQYSYPKTSQAVEHSDPLKSTPGSHSQLVSDSVMWLLAFWHLCSQSALRHCIYVASAFQYLELITVLDYS